ncbi:MAG TPA: UbiA-like polyprenyltransferase [Bacteroidales bacterium]|nr:UbiA-like polyprenyltransferase [Bacteroidales bacterium]
MSVNEVSKYLSLVKFSHTLFAMPFAFIGYFLALKYGDSYFSLKLLLLVVACMVFARNTAMAFNRYADRHIDLHNPRTALREIPAGILKAESVLVFTIINAVLFIATTWFINPMAFYLSPVALFVITGYSLTKRFTVLCHFILGLGLSLAPIGAYIAVTAHFHWLPILFSFIVLTWVSGFDIMYALQDERFDNDWKLKSIPAKLGSRRALILSILLHTISAFLVVLAGTLAHMNLLYWIGAGVFITLLIYQHLIVKPNDISKVNLAFATTNGIASVVFAAFAIADMLFT